MFLACAGGRGPRVYAPRGATQPTTHDVLAPKLARNAMPFKPSGVNYQSFRKLVLKPV